MKKVDLIKVFIASPGDVLDQRNLLENIIWQWNNEHTDSKNTILMPIRWENNSTASYRINQDGQAVINEQILEDSDILIAIFGHKIGTRTMSGKSGTVEEINYFYDKYKRGVGIFFVEGDSVPKEFISDYSMVEKYKKHLETEHRGIYDKFDLVKIRSFLTKEVTLLNGENFDQNAEIVNIDSSLIFNDIESDEEEQLLLLFIAESKTRDLGARWLSEETIQKIEIWERENNLNNYLSQNYQSALFKLEEKKLIFPKEYTSHGNVRLYSSNLELYKKLKIIINSNSTKVNEIKIRNGVTINLNDGYEDNFELPF